MSELKKTAIFAAVAVLLGVVALATAPSFSARLCSSST